MRFTIPSLALLALALTACGGDSPTGADLGGSPPPGSLYRSGGASGDGGLQILAGTSAPGAPFAIVLDANQLTLDEGGTVALTARVVNPSGNTVNGDAWAITFTSGDPSVFTVNSSGVVTAVAPGTATLTLTARTLSKTIPVTVYGHPTGATRTTTTTPAGYYPFGAAVSATGAVLITIKSPINVVLRGDLPSTTLPVSIPVGTTPTGVTPDFIGAEAYVTNQGSSSLGVIDLLGSPNSQVTTVPLAGNPFVSALSPDGRTVWVALGSVAKVALVDIASRTVTATINVGGGPNGIAFSGTPSAPYAYVSNTSNGTITVINVNTNTVTATLTTGGRPQGMGFSRDFQELYVANETLGRLEVWNTATNTKTADVALGGNPFGVAVSPDDKQVWVTDLTGKLHTVDRVARTFTTTTLGGRPRRLSFDRFGGTLVVANESGWVDFVR